MSNRRIRTIKPEFFTDGRVMRWDDSTRFLYIGLMSCADDRGRFRAEPSVLAVEIWLGEFSRDPVATLAKIARCLATLCADGRVELYDDPEGTGEQYGAIASWSKHQRIEKFTESRIPAPPGWDEDAPAKPRKRPAKAPAESGTPPADVRDTSGTCPGHVPDTSGNGPGHLPNVSGLDLELDHGSGAGAGARATAPAAQDDDFIGAALNASASGANDDTVTDSSPVERRVAHVVSLYARVTGSDPGPGDDMALARWCTAGRPLAAIAYALDRMAEEARRKAGTGAPHYSVRLADAILVRARPEEYDVAALAHRAPSVGPSAVEAPVLRVVPAPAPLVKPPITPSMAVDLEAALAACKRRP